MSKVLGEKVKENYARLSFFQKMLNSLKKAGFTPNKLTLVSFIFGIFGVGLVFLNYVLAGWGLLMFSLLFDALDGAFARKFRMESRFGEWLDKTKDFILFGIVYIAVAYIGLIPWWMCAMLIFATSSSITSTLFAKYLKVKRIPFPYFTVSTFFVIGIFLNEYILIWAMFVLFLEIFALIANYSAIIAGNIKR